jgi:hypothetical protein
MAVIAGLARIRELGPPGLAGPVPAAGQRRGGLPGSRCRQTPCFIGKTRPDLWQCGPPEIGAASRFRRISKKPPKCVDGLPCAAIMPRSLRSRCTLVDPQRNCRRPRAVISSPIACIIVGPVEKAVRVLFHFVAKSVLVLVKKYSDPFFASRSLTIQSDNLCGCLRWTLRRQNQT